MLYVQGDDLSRPIGSDKGSATHLEVRSPHFVVAESLDTSLIAQTCQEPSAKDAAVRPRTALLMSSNTS